MGSQMLQMLQMPQRIMALTKFSAATTSNGYNGPIPWTHIMNEPSLSVSFDVYESRSFSQSLLHFQRLKVSHAVEVLEDINLGVLGPAAEQATTEATVSGRLYKTPECCIIVQCPCIAMRYPIDDNQVRRFQIRLANREEFFEALSLLTNARVPTTEAGALPNQKPSISRAPISSINHTDSQRATTSISTNPGATSQITRNGQPGQLFCRTHPTNLPAPPPVVSHVSSVSWSQHQRDAFQPSDIYGGTGTLVPSRHLQTTNRIELVPASSAPVSAGGLGESHINLYTPRPSTAPIGQAKTPGRDLPPERMLPFTTNPIIQQASVPGRVEDSVVPMGDTLRNTPKTMMKQDKGDFKLGTMPSFATPRYSSQTSIMDTSRLQNVAAVDEEEIDTQEILAKAQARLARSSTRLNQTKNAGEFKCVADGHNTTTSQKKRRNLRCLQCRSARTKCERDAKNPEGTCQPCQAKERQCSFAADADFHSEACETEKPAVYAQNSQEEAQSETQSLRRSARQQEASLKADVNSLPPRIMSPEPPKEVKVVKHEVSKKRVIKSSSIDIEQKRPKTSDVSSLRHPPGTPPHFVKSTHSRCQPQPALGKARTHNRTLQEVTNLSAHPRSDATTITTVTSDLDAPYPISPVKKMADVTPAEPKPPLSHQLEADPDAREVQDQHNDTENTTSVRSPLTPSKFGSNIRADEVPISTFLNLHDSEQSTMLDKFFATAIQDDDFLQFCKILENRYEPMLFPNKW